MDDEFQEILDIINLVFIISFSIEMVIKLIGFGLVHMFLQCSIFVMEQQSLLE